MVENGIPNTTQERESSKWAETAEVGPVPREWETIIGRLFGNYQGERRSGRFC